MKKLVFFILIFAQPFWAQVKGVVFLDSNKNNLIDKGEKTVADVLISNGKDIVKTNKKGKYTINLLPNNPLFIIKPKGFISPKNKDSIVQFFINPYDIKNKNQVNFPLYKQKEKNFPKVALLGDPQADVMDDIHHVGKLVTEELISKDIDFMVPLGDLSFDNLAIFKPLSKTLGLVGVPVFYTIGNHDLDYKESFDDTNEKFEKHFGPSYYAFEYGKEFFLVLNNIFPIGNNKYEGRINNTQQEFIKNLLALKKNINKITVFMHIPLEQLKDKEWLISQLSSIKNVLIATGHTHTQYHKFFHRKNNSKIHQLVTGAVCGSWWRGPHDINGIPFALMDDGTEKGYWLVQYTNNSYKLKYHVSGAPQKQMNVWTPETKEWDTDLNKLKEPFIYANVFAANANTKVSISFDRKNWKKMQYYKGISPKLKYLYHLQQLGRFKNLKISKIPKPKTKSTHLWRIAIPKNLTKGIYLLRVNAFDKKLNINTTTNKVFWNE